MTTGKKNRRALGRGLDALLPQRPSPQAPTNHANAHGVFSCPVDRISPQRGQPRRHFDDTALAGLAATIREHGVIQPIVVRRIGNDQYEIIAGERRWRAAQRADKKEVPVVIKDIGPDDAYELALIENLQREDLNPIEIAKAYERLLSDHDNTHEDLAERVGKSRVAVSNALRLLKLPEPVHAFIRDGRLSEGHGRALLGASSNQSMIVIARKAVHAKLSVRKVEALVRKERQARETPAPSTTDEGKSAGVRDLELRFTRRLGAKTTLDHKGKGGRILINYANLDELDRIIAAIGA